MRFALATLLELEDDVPVAAVARGDEVVAMVGLLRPDVVLLDVELPGRSGLDILPAVAGEAVVDPVLAVHSLRVRPNPHNDRERRVIATSADSWTIVDIAGNLPPVDEHRPHYLSSTIDKTDSRSGSKALSKAHDAGRP